MKKGIIYSRVSTTQQDYERQVQNLELFAKRNDIEVVHSFAEKVTGTKQAKNRKEAHAMLEYLKGNDIDIVLVHELSRLGRSTIDVQNTIQEITEILKVNLYIHQYSLQAYPNGQKNPMFKFFTDILANIAQMERDQLSERVKSGIKAYRKKNGEKWARPKGSTKAITDTKNYNLIVKELRANEKRSKKLGVRKLAKLCDVSVNTIQKIKQSL